MGRSLHLSVFMTRHWILMISILTACAVDPETDDNSFDFEVDTDSGKADGVAVTFNANNVLTDELFSGAETMEASDVQAFLEESPYGTRSWLASETIDGVSAAQAIVDAARAEQIHPLVLIARMQVETSLISKTVRPSQRMIDRAMGCACPDGGTCSTSQKGLSKQLQCGAHTLRRLFDASTDGSGQWRKGTARRTLDPRTVTPANDATAALYAYTPWVLVGTGGTWLAWNVTRKYVRHAEKLGLVH